MRAKFLALLLSAALLLSPAAQAADWSRHTVRCAENNLGCRLLQMAMMGSFASFDPEDTLSVRLFSAAYPVLCNVEEADFAHFMREFGEAEEPLRQAYFRALANCLWADILSQGLPRARLRPAQRVALLFLDPAGEAQADVQMEEIRALMTPEVLSSMAEELAAPAELLSWLLEEKESP